MQPPLMSISLRRLAQTNNASSTSSSPMRASRSIGESASLLGSPVTPRTPRSPYASRNSTPLTPRTQIIYPISPENSESRSASLPFDWEAARLRRPPPYASPVQSAKARSIRKSDAASASRGTAKRVVRKKSLYERVMSIPSRIMFEITIFPHNIPTPEPKTSALLIGAIMHFTNLCICISKSRRTSEDGLWNDLYDESRGVSWFDWTTPLTFTLVISSFFVAFNLFSRVKLYNLHHRTDLVNSPHAAFVAAELDFSPLESLPIARRATSWILYQLSTFWRFLFNLKPTNSQSSNGTHVNKVQQLSVWDPTELELRLFAIYSPAHAFSWMTTTSSNWIVMFGIMGIISLQLQLMTNNFDHLLKDRAIISAEVMHEYDEKFVIPRVNPIRKDAAVMTHEAELVAF